MSRAGKLACGVLLLVIAGLVAFLTANGRQAAVDPVLTAAFGVPGFLLLVAGVVPPRSARVKMVFSAARLITGIGISLAGAAAVYLFYEVIHVAPRIVLVGAMLAVPGGLLYAASCWREVDAASS